LSISAKRAKAMVRKHGGIRAASRAEGVPYTSLHRAYHQTRTGGLKTVAVITDIHFPYQDELALDITLSYLKDKDIDTLVLLGDIIDCYAVSPWRKDPQRMRFPDELAMARNGIQRIRDVFPEARMVYIAGNHEERLTAYLWGKATELVGLEELDLPALLGLDEMDITYINNRENMAEGGSAYSIGNLYFLHGHEVFLSRGCINLARTMYLKSNSNVMFGHFHQSQDYISRTLGNEYKGCWSVGSLCKTSELYSPFNNWVNGFAVIRVDDDGKFAVRNHIIIEGRVL